MSKLSDKAFAIMAMCEERKEHFGITVDPRQGCYAFVWAFKIKKEQARRERTARNRAYGDYTVVRRPDRAWENEMRRRRGK